MSIKPVSIETLASIPWMSSKRVAHCMRDVSIRGPTGIETWQKLIGRADMVAHTMNPKQGALVLNALARSRPAIEDVPRFLKRFNVRFLSNILTHANPIDSAQILHACRELCVELDSAQRDVVLGRIDPASMDAPTLALTLHGVSPLLESCAKRQEISSLLVSRAIALLSSPPLNEQLLAQTILFISETNSSITQLVPVVINHISSMSIRCLVLTCSGFGRERTTNQELVSLISERIASDKSIAMAISVKQLAVLLRSLQKMNAMNLNVCYQVVQWIGTRSKECDISTLEILLAGLSRMEGTMGVIEQFCGANRGIITGSSSAGRKSILASLNRVRGKSDIVDRLIEELEVEMVD